MSPTPARDSVSVNTTEPLSPVEMWKAPDAAQGGDLTDIDCWLRTRHPDWRGDFYMKAVPGPDPRHLAHLTFSEQNADDVRPLTGLGYNSDGPEPGWTWRVVHPSAQAQLSAHRRIEGVARIEAASMKSP